MRFFNIHSVAKLQKKIEREPLGDFEKLSKKKRIFNSLIVPKNLKGTIWDFLTFVVAEYQKKLKRGPFGDIEKCSKKVSQSRKRRLKAENVRAFCFGVLVKKIAHMHGSGSNTNPLG